MPSDFGYPVLAYPALGGMYRRPRRHRLLGVAASLLVVPVVLLTLSAVLARPQPQPCRFACAPNSGPRLLAPAVYHNAKWGYSVQYDSSALSIAGTDADGVQLTPVDGDGEIDFTAARGSDAGGMVRSLLNNVPSSTFQDQQVIGPVRGAEVGFVDGQGTALSAQFVAASGGGAAEPVSFVCLAATRNGLTIGVIAFSQQELTVQNAPYGLDKGPLFDYPVSNALWPGQS